MSADKQSKMVMHITFDMEKIMCTCFSWVVEQRKWFKFVLAMFLLNFSAATTCCSIVVAYKG